LEIAIY